MEENLLKYFTNNNTYTNETIEPINVENQIVSNLSDYESYVFSIVTNDSNYFIRYGGRPLTGGYNAIEVYNNDALKNGTPLYNFSNLKIYGHTFVIRDMKQDENGRFYAVGYYIGDGTIDEEYFILFNNFIADGYCEIRKFYTANNMGLPNGAMPRTIVKKEGSADYYLRDIANNKIYHFKIDIVQGNSLETYNYTSSSSLEGSGSITKLEMIKDTLIKTTIIEDETGNVSCTKLVINTAEEIKNSYEEIEVFYKEIEGDILLAISVRNFKYYRAYFEPAENGYLLMFEVIDLIGNVKYYNPPGIYQWTDAEGVSFADNYITFKQENTLEIFYYDKDNIIKFYTGNFTGAFSQIQVLKEFNLVNIVGLNSRTSLAYSMNVYSVGYSSTPYLNKNFLIPQYLNLYSDSLIFSRDVINRFLAGNQLTTTFNVPNYLLNNTQINREAVYGQTNLAITDNIKTYTKNRFESLYLTYIYGIQIIDNTNENNLLNVTGSNRLANSVWSILDDTNAACLKARITHEDGLQSILTLDTTNISDDTCTINYNLSGNIRKIEYLSNDEQTVYATYRCELSGTNTITQTITIS